MRTFFLGHASAISSWFRNGHPGEIAGSARPATQQLIPLQLYEILEKEYVGLHGALPGDYPGWELTLDQVDVDKLPEDFASAADGSLAALLRQKLFNFGLAMNLPIEAGDAWLSGLMDNRSLQQAFISTCNALLLKDIPEGAIPAEISAGPVSLPMLKKETGQLDERDAALLKRLLIESALPSAIKKIEDIRFKAIRDRIHGVQPGRSALCLSGGGIRSAAYGLGILQGLARQGLLDKFDYLSTVSGGGYIGSWLSAWIHRHADGLTGVSRELANVRGQAPFKTEPGPLVFLRTYSRYLNPRSGFFSADTWAWIGIYLRNLLLNWLALIPLLLLALAIPRLYVALLAPDFFYSYAPAAEAAKQIAFWLATAGGVLAIACATVSRPGVSDPAPRARKGMDAAGRESALDRWRRKFKTQPWILGLGIFPLVGFACLLTLLLGGVPGLVPLPLSGAIQWLRDTPLSSIPGIVPILAITSIVLWGQLLVLLAWVMSLRLLPARAWSKRLLELAAMLAAGECTWLMLGRLGHIANLASQDTVSIWLFSLPSRLVYATVAGPLAIAACLVGMTLFIGLVSKCRWIDDEDYEWWARFGGWLLIVTVSWLALNVIVIIGPAILMESPKIMAAAGGASGLFALLLGKSSLSSALLKAPDSGSKRSGNLANLGVNLLALVALLFLCIFLAFLSLLSTAVLPLLADMLNHVPLLPQADFPLRPIGAIIPGAACSAGSAAMPVFDLSLLQDPALHFDILCLTPPRLVAAAILITLLVGVGASFCIKLNKFSLHGAYRNRLIRTFLGASRGAVRKPNPFTGFDSFDNVQMHELQAGLLRESDILDLPALLKALKQALAGQANTSAASAIAAAIRSSAGNRELAAQLEEYQPGSVVLKSLQRNLVEGLNRVLEAQDLARQTGRQYQNLIYANRRLLEAAFPDGIRKYSFPPQPPHKLLHVVNLALNLVHGRNLAWQERKASSFIVTPMHAGSLYLGFRESRRYGGPRGISLGTAATISGAAVSPNMGYSSSAVVTLLLTLFNVRLGWWLGNPGMTGRHTYTLASPRFWLRAVLSEAFGLTDDRSAYVYLSDGGHFENLGLYEMVLRRNRFIVLSDAAADPDYTFESLANAVRKIRIDFGIPIEFESMKIHGKKEGADSEGCYCAVGKIGYSQVDGDAQDGLLIYFKPAVYGREASDILHYKAKNPAFPQEPTRDQFFGESQFESYRSLGEYAVAQVCGAIGTEVDRESDQLMLAFTQSAARHCKVAVDACAPSRTSTP
jgi:hypothetical protein